MHTIGGDLAPRDVSTHFPSDTSADVTAAVARSVAAFAILRRSTPAERSGWLEALADALDSSCAELVAIAVEETALPTPRLEAEVARTSGQLRLFASVLRDGAYAEAIIDHSRPDTTPPAPDLRRILVAIGPVAVFSASNFPFAFSVLGGDTASALAAGCPVVVKAHSGHPMLSARTGEIAIDALARAGAPAGILGVVTGRESGIGLVTAPGIAAVGFTGSVQGGRLFFDLASARPDPIPFFGELGSVNPVFVTARADHARADTLAAGLVSSFQSSLGQLCTKPGIVFVPEGGRFEQEVAAALDVPASGRLLTDSIQRSFRADLDEASGIAGVRIVAGAAKQPEDGPAVAVVLAAELETVAAAPELLEERFGPTTLLVTYRSLEDALRLAETIGGNLTATVHAEANEMSVALADRLVGIAGRVLFEGWPTGVSVTWAQHHGGPWPATTSSHTSVGPTAVRRFLRPVAYQSAPDVILPAELQEDNPLGILRRVDGILTR